MHIRKDPRYKELMQFIANKVVSALRPDVIQMIVEETDHETVNVLISASPEDYVRQIAQNLGWPCIASELRNGHFIHCYGQNKIKLLQKHFPREKFEYNFAISDSSSDLALLQMFKKHELLSR